MDKLGNKCLFGGMESARRVSKPCFGCLLTYLPTYSSPGTAVNALFGSVVLPGLLYIQQRSFNNQNQNPFFRNTYIRWTLLLVASVKEYDATSCSAVKEQRHCLTKRSNIKGRRKGPLHIL